MKNVRYYVVAIVLIAMASTYIYFLNRPTSYHYTGELESLDKMEKTGLPGFSVKDIEGSAVNLDQFKGKTVIVNFWASWCGPCVEEFPALINLIESSQGKVELIAISQDSSLDELQIFLKAFPKYQNKNIHIVWDADKTLGALYDVDRLPESFVADKNIKLAKKVIGGVNWDSKESIEYLKSMAN